MIRIFPPMGLSEFKLIKTDLEDPLTLPYDILDDKKSEILNMLLYGFREQNPRFLWVDWSEIDIKGRNFYKIKGVKLDENTVLCISIKSEKDLAEVYKNLRWFKSLVTIIDVQVKAEGKVNRKWLDKMKKIAYNAIRSAIFKKKVVDPELFENFPFLIALKTFEDPVDMVEFFDDATRRILDGVWFEIAAKDAISDILVGKLSMLDAMELKSILMLLKSEEVGSEAIESLESRGLVRVYHGETVPSQILKNLKDPRILERSFGTIINSVGEDEIGDDYKEFAETLKPGKGEPEPVMRLQKAVEEMPLTVELRDIEPDLLRMEIPEDLLKNPEKLIERENEILWAESDEGARGKALILRAFGYLEKGDLMRAERDLETACKVNPEIIRNASPLLLRIGEAYLDAGRYRDAERCYLKVLEISKETEYDEGTATSLYRLGNIHQGQGRYDEAVTMYQESLKISEELGYIGGIADVLYNMGWIHQEYGRYEEAGEMYEESTEMYEESLKISEELGDKQSTARTLHRIGLIHYDRGRYDEAAKMYKESLKISEERGDKQSIARTLHNLGNTYYGLGRYDEAAKMCKESLKMYEELGNKSGIANTLVQRGMVFHVQGNHKEALRCYLNAFFTYPAYGDLARLYILELKHEIGEALYGRYHGEVTANK